MKSYTFEKRLSEVHKTKKLSQDELGKMLDVHGAVIGRYERDVVKPSIEVTVSISDALEIYLDYLVGNIDLLQQKNILKRINDIQKLSKDDRNTVFVLLDTFLRDTKTKQTYSELY